ncbi:MAG: protelomerase family protein [Phormidesmis sp.]
MPTTVVNPITKESLAPYAKLGKSNGKVRSHIIDLLFRLVQTDDPAKVKELCLSEVAWLEDEYTNPNTRTSYVTAYRKALSAYFAEHLPPAILLSEYKGVSQHLALCHLFAADEDYAQKTASTKAKTAKQRDNLTAFNAAAAVNATELALMSDDWRELAAGLIMAVQCRPSDMLQAGKFKAISKYRLEFTTGLKKRGKTVTGEIFCLVDTLIFMDAFSRLRREPDVMEMKDWKLIEVDSGKNKTLNRAVRRIFGDKRDSGEIIPVPHGEKELSCKNLRAAGVNVSYWLHGRDDQSLGRFAELQLLHDNPGTAANYEDFYAADADGNRLLKVGVLKDEKLSAKPQSEKRSSISVDAQLRDMLKNPHLGGRTEAEQAQWADKSQSERLEHIIARALQANGLERDRDRAIERQQKAEFALRQLQRAAMEHEPVTEDEFIRAEDMVAAKPSGFDWRDVPNAELMNDCRHDAYHEKLRRSVEAVQDYNAGRELDEQFAITGSLLRQLAPVTPRKVAEWVKANKADIEAYNSGYSGRQNVGKPDPKSVIKWSEAAYGAYDW